MAVDGSLNFDARIDINGINQGLQSILQSVNGTLQKISKQIEQATQTTAKSTQQTVGSAKRVAQQIKNSVSQSILKLERVLGGLKAKVMTAFSIVTVVNFGKTCISTATEVENAWVGLNSIINGQGKSFDNAKKFIQEYISDGLVPLRNAVIAYKNLSLRGYNTEQIETVMNAFKNSATYARQSQYSLGDAISTATEGLKNENSIVVDNAGVTKNVAKMWKDYAKSIGVSYTNLTKQQKIEAEVTGIIEETKFQMGDAAKYSNTYSGQIARLSASFTNLKVKIGNILKVVVSNFLPVINNAINLVGKFVDKITNAFNNLGIQTDVVDTLSDVSNGVENTTENLEEMEEQAEEAEKRLAGFDKLNVLSEDKDNSDDGETSTATTLPVISPTVNTSPIENSINILSDIFEKLKQKLQPVIDALKRLKDALEPLKTFTYEALEDFYKDFLKPLGEWVLGTGLPKFIDIITDLINKIDWEKLNKALDDFWKSLEPFAESIGNGLLWFLENVLSPLAKWTINDVIPVFLDTLTAALDGLNSVIEALKSPVKWLFDKMIKPLGELSSNEFSNISIKIPDGLKRILDEFSKLIEALQPFFNWLIDTINPAIFGIVKGVSFILQGVLDFIINAISGIIEALTGIIDFLTGIFTGDWEKVWNGIKEIFKGIFDIIAGIVTGIGETLAGLVYSIGGTATSILQGAWDIGTNLINGILKGITDLFGNIGNWIKEHIVDPWIESFKQLFGIHSPSTVMAEIGVFIIRGLLNGLKDKFIAVIDWLKTLPEKFKDGFLKVVDAIKQPFSHITNWFKDTFSKAWEAVKNVFSTGGKIFDGIKDGISSVFKNVVNSLIDGINNVIAVPFNAINTALKTVKSLEIAGWKPFEWITSIAVPQIPKLATGTVVPASYGEYLAVLGDNKREPEVVSPLSTMKQAMREVIAEMNISANSNVEYRFVAELNGKPLFEEVIRQDRIDRKRHGGRSRLGTVG